jgi:hypothetical protein
MTLVSQIIFDAHRESNLIGINATLTSPEQAEALRLLNRILSSTLGNEAGQNLETFPLGSNNISSPAGYPWYTDTPTGDWFSPVNKRLVLNLNEAATVPLSPFAEDGARMGVIDVSGNLSTYNLTLIGNGANIEGSPTLVLSEDNVGKEWFFRADQGNWKLASSLVAEDEWPFPEAYDDMFTIMLAMRLNPRQSVALGQETLQAFKRSARQFKARYSQVIEKPVEEALLRMTKSHAETGDRYNNYDDTNTFNRGFPW